MASIKDEKDDRDDSDADDIDRDSESDKSSTTTDSSDASDSDDSSEMDAEECERRRNELLDAIADLERQFATLREQLYRERIMQVKTQLEEVHDGTAKEYRQPLEELQQNMKTRIEVAGVLRKLRLENIDNNYKAEEMAAKQNFENEKLRLFDSMKEDLEEKIRRLDEDRNSIDFQNDLYSSEKSKKQSGKIWKKKSSDSSRRKPVTVTGPYIVYMLSEADILDDWTEIRKSLSKKQVDRKYAARSYSRPTLTSRVW
uniref:Breast cancer metastasis-suppressor 1-like protein-A n=1 Tax=Lygus hesperus TaxID=30085 RepID=A0A0K8S5X5_LYGHE